jgi:hypothetical protein
MRMRETLYEKKLCHRYLNLTNISVYCHLTHVEYRKLFRLLGSRKLQHGYILLVGNVLNSRQIAIFALATISFATSCVQQTISSKNGTPQISAAIPIDSKL